MLNFINSHSNYAYTNVSNINSNTTNSALANSTNSAQNSNFAKDKSQATSEILGYGVDNDGFFTQDFNEAAGIPKSFKIHAKQIKSFYDTFTSFIPTHNSIDIAKTLGNAYKAFESEMGTNLQQNYSADEFARLSATNKRLSDKLNSINALQNELDKQGLKAENIDFGAFLSPNTLSPYTQDERIDKSALFALYINSDFIEGEVNMYGKIMGLDKTMSKAQVQELQNFINDNQIAGLLGVGANPSNFENIMRASDLSIAEFKEKWLEFKAQAEKKFELTNVNKTQSTGQNSGTNLQNLSINLTQNENEQNLAQKRSPIQVTSKSQTYTDSYFAKYKSILEDTQKEQMFEILFGVNLSKAGKNGVLNGANLNNEISNSGFSSANGTDLNTTLMSLNLSKIKPLNKVDIKA